MIVTEQQVIADLAWTLPPARRVVAFAPHPDDEVFGCGGALALLREQDVDITVIIVTDGAMGGDNADGRIVEKRADESRMAAQALGLGEPVFWRYGDRSLATNGELVDRMAEALRVAVADLVLLPAPTELHPDHQALAFAGVEALRRLGGNCHAAFYEISAPLPRPTLLLDISRVEEKKALAMRCFTTQLQELPYDQRISGLNKFRAYFMGSAVTGAEAYVVARPSDLAEGLPAVFEWPVLLRCSIAEKNARIDILERAVVERDEKGAEQAIRLAEQDAHLAEQGAQLAERDARIGILEQAIAERAHQLMLANRTIVERDSLIERLYRSTSWRITAPIRYLGGKFRRLLKG